MVLNDSRQFAASLPTSPATRPAAPGTPRTPHAAAATAAVPTTQGRVRGSDDGVAAFKNAASHLLPPARELCSAALERLLL